METLATNSAPLYSAISQEIFDGSSSFQSEFPVSEETLVGSSPSLQTETLGALSLVPSPSNSNGSLPSLGKEPQYDLSLVPLPSHPTGSSTIFPPIDETLDGSSPSSPAKALDAPDGSSPLAMQTETLDEYSNPPTFGDEKAEEEDGNSSYSPNRLFGNNLSDYSSSHWSSSWSSHLSSSSSSPSPWYSAPKEPAPSWRSWSSSEHTEHTRPSLALSFSISESKPSTVGAGLANLGNTCFINAVLQCFTHTVLLVKGLRTCNHVMPCDRQTEGFCVICDLRDQIEHSLASSGGVLSPLKLVDNLNHFSSYFQRYQQEDAHEFLQCFLDKLERCCLYSKVKDKSLLAQDDNLVERIFGGRLISKLRCCNCGHYSDTYEPLIDLSLEIEDVDTLPSALESFTKVEKIEDSETKFTCENCKEEVLVEKQLMLDQAPSVAAFHLKRFKTDGAFVEKVDKHVEFPLELDLQPYTTGSHNNNNVELKYELYAIVVHIGFSSTSGHYFCFIRSSPDTWHRLDDSKVTSVREDYVLSQEAYILFYARKGTPWFTSLMEVQKPCLDPNILNTSPKSVLDNVDGACTSDPSVLSTDTCDANESGDAAEGISSDFSCGTRPQCFEDNETTDVVNGSSAHLFCRSKEDVNGFKNDSRDETPMNNTSSPIGASNCSDGTPYNNEKICTSLEEKNCHKGPDEVRDNDCFHPLTPPESPSPDIVSLQSPEVKYHIPRGHLKLEKNVSCKRPLNKALEDSQRKEAVKLVTKSMSRSRGSKFIAAVLGSQSEGSLNKRRKRVGSSPCKKASPPSARRKANHSSVMHHQATAIFR